MADDRPLTNNGLVIGTGGSAPPRAIAALTNGQIPIGSTGNAPVPGTITGTGLDVTVGGGTLTLGIADDAVTYAKMQNISAASRLLGRGSAAGAGNPEEITLTAALDMAGTALGIADNAVTYAKMQNVSAASRLLGRGSAAGAGNVEELTLATGLSLAGTVLGPRQPLALVSLTYGATITAPNIALGDLFSILISDFAAHALPAPTNGFSGASMTLMFVNAAGGVVNTCTFHSSIRQTSYAPPVAGQYTSGTFRFDGSNWYQQTPWAAYST